MNRLRPRRGEIWLTRLDPTEGNEIRKTRPCLVVSPSDLNSYVGTVVIVPMTSGSHPARFRVRSNFRGVEGLLLAEQICSLSKERLLKRLGVLDDATLSKALAVLREMFEE